MTRSQTKASHRGLGSMSVEATVAVALLAASIAVARTGAVSDLEERAFGAVNGMSDAVYPPTWLVMQTGALGGALAAGAVAAVSGRPALGARLAGWGTVTWAGAKVGKRYVRRGRPVDHLPGVRFRGTPAAGLGFPSGHAAVAATLAALVAADGHRRTGRLLALAAGITGLARLYVGAHLPLDVVGGWLLGALVARAAPFTEATATASVRAVWGRL